MKFSELGRVKEATKPSSTQIVDTLLLYTKWNTLLKALILIAIIIFGVMK